MFEVCVKRYYFLVISSVGFAMLRVILYELYEV